MSQYMINAKSSPQYKDILKNPDRAFAKARNYVMQRVELAHLLMMAMEAPYYVDIYLSHKSLYRLNDSKFDLENGGAGDEMQQNLFPWPRRGF